MQRRLEERSMGSGLGGTCPCPGQTRAPSGHMFFDGKFTGPRAGDAVASLDFRG